MSLPNSLGAYRDCEDLCDSALADPKGTRACLGTKGEARHMITRLNYFRSLQRDANSRMYKPGDPQHGTSAYDDLVFTMREDEEGSWWVYLEPRAKKVLTVEPLSQVEGE